MGSIQAPRIPRAFVGALFGLLVVASVLAACGTSSTTSVQTPEKPLIQTDLNGTQITIPDKAPERIVSLTPTASEVLAALNLDSKVVGVDAFTDYPASMAAKTKVTDQNGTPNVEQIVGLKPDLVFSYSGTKASEQQLLQAGVKVVDLPITDLDEALTEIRLAGQITKTESAANTLAASMQQQIDAVKSKVATAAHPSVYMEIGYSPAPPYAFGGGSFGDELIIDAGGTDIFHSDTDNGGYPAVSDESIIAAKPDVIVLTEPVDFGGDPTKVASRPGWSTIPAVQSNHIFTIDPNLIQRPGPRIVQGLQQLAKDLHPELFP
jgi:ABC-type Fe3+-hydroxamate transport system substrate-binding protein